LISGLPQLLSALLTTIPPYPVAYWSAQLISASHIANSALLYYRNCRPHAILLASLPEMSSLVRNPTKLAFYDDKTQQPTFPVEFLGGSNCSSVPSISSIIYIPNV
jgi:hypothetical protein